MCISIALKKRKEQVMNWTLSSHIPNQPQSWEFVEQTVVDCFTINSTGTSCSRTDPNWKLRGLGGLLGWEKAQELGCPKTSGLDRKEKALREVW